jgi:hypothetical protein
MAGARRALKGRNTIAKPWHSLATAFDFATIGPKSLRLACPGTNSVKELTTATIGFFRSASPRLAASQSARSGHVAAFGRGLRA